MDSHSVNFWLLLVVGAGFTASVVEDWVQGESINLVNAVVSALFCAVFALNGTTGSQYKTKSTTLGIKGTIKGISKRTGTWTKGLKQIYTNKLNIISGQIVSQIKSGFLKDFAFDSIDYLLRYGLFGG